MAVEGECLHCAEASSSYESCSFTSFTTDIVPVLPNGSLWQAPWTPTGQKPSRSACLAAEDDAEYDQQLHEQEYAAWVAQNQHSSANGGSPSSPVAPTPLAFNPGLRAHAVDWLVDVAWQLALSNDTLHLAVQLLDRYLAAAAAARLKCGPAAALVDAMAMPAERLWLLGAACLWAAAKYEECSAPRAASFLALLSPTGYPAVACKADLLRAEVALLRAVGHRLSLPTAKTFLRRTLSRVPVDRPSYFMAGYLCELSLLEGGCLSLLPSQVAAASYVWAMALLQRKVDSTSVLQLTGYSLPELIEPLHIIKELHALVYSAPRDCAIRVKYSSADLDTVALLPPLPEPHVAHGSSDVYGSSAVSEMEIEHDVYVPVGGMAPVSTDRQQDQQQRWQVYQSHGSCQQAGAGYLPQQHAATATSCC